MKSAKQKKVSKPKEKINLKEYFLHYLFCLSIVILLFLAAVNINKFLDNQKVLGAAVDVSPLQNEKTYWQQIVNTNPSYIDGLLQLAKVNLELGDKNAAKELISKAFEIDPNSLKIAEVKKLLSL